MLLPFTETNEIRGLVEELEVSLPPPAEQVDALIEEAATRMRQPGFHGAVAAAWIHVAVHEHLDAQVRQVRALDLRINTEQPVWMAVEEASEDVGMDRRLANALWDAFFGRDMTAGHYRSLTDVSPATATKDLTTAVAAGLLASEGERGGRRYFARERLYRAVADTLSIEIETASSARARIGTSARAPTG